MARVCAVAAGKDGGELVKRARQSLEDGADMVELRLDHLMPPSGRLGPEELKRALESYRTSGLLGSVETILTLRAPVDGGIFDGPEEMRRNLLGQLVRTGAAWVDLEGWLPESLLRELAGVAREAGSWTLISWHLDSIDEWETAEKHARQVARDGMADAVKIVLPTKDRAGLNGYLTLSEHLSRAGLPHVVIPSGRLGRAGRILAPVTGTEWVYAEHSDGEVTGHLGLPAIEDVSAAWARMGLRPGSDPGANISPPLTPSDAGSGWVLLALLGDPVTHTKSPTVHHAAMRALGLRGAYLPLRTPLGGMEASLKALEAAGAIGCNVTIPLKMEAAACVNVLGESARLSKAVNTIVLRHGGTRQGENTDVEGVRRSVVELLGREGDGRTALVLGTGGAARGAAAGLDSWGAKILATGRSLSKLTALKADLEVTIEPVDPNALSSLKGDVDILVQCTSQGMPEVPPEGHLAPVEVFEAVRPSAVLDMVYTPGRTEVVQRALAKDLPAAGGERPLLHQAVACFSLWTGKKVPKEMETALEEALGLQRP
jgi:shikimate dehydrogenase